ncbi:MAG: hypothetical protein WA632_10150, partial [Gallionella sp.]
RGLIQVTGRLNYHLTAQRMKNMLLDHATSLNNVPEVPNFEDEPEMLERPYWAAMSAALYWNIKNLNQFADNHDFVKLTRRINGGINGLSERQALFASAFSSLIRVGGLI